MANEAEGQQQVQEVVTHESLVDSFKWDVEDDGIFTPPQEETKEDKQRKVVEAVKTDEPIKPKEEKEAKEDGKQQSKGEHKFFESEEDKTTKDTEGAEDKSPEGKGSGQGNGDTILPSGDVEPDLFFKTLALELKEKNIFSSIEILEDDEIDEDRFFELQEEELQARVDEAFVSIFEELNNDPDAVAFLKFKKQGGRTYDFMNTFRQANTLPDDLDLTEVANQEKVLKYYYLNIEKIDEEDIDEKLTFVKELGKTDVYAKKYFKEINDKDKQAKLALITNQENIQKDNKIKAEKLKAKLQQVLDTGTGEASFKFTSEDAKELVSYITKPTIKVGNTYLTAFQAKIGEVMRDEKKMLTLAKILKKDFDVPDLKKAVTTEVSKRVKSTLQEAKSGQKTGRSIQAAEKSLADMFPE